MEIKMRIKDPAEMERHLVSIGASFYKEVSVKDTYFNTGTGDVLKVSETNEGNFLIRLRATGTGFEYLQNDTITNPAAVMEELARDLGVRSVLVKKRRLYLLKDYLIDVSVIEGVGSFLIVVGDGLSNEVAAKMLKMSNPEFVTVPFDRLPRPG